MVFDVFLRGSACRPPAEIHFGHIAPAFLQRETALVSDAQHLKAVGLHRHKPAIDSGA
jgi:hypothetical protein